MTRLWRLLGVKPDEIPVLKSLLAVNFLVMAAFILSKAARDSLFLESWPATSLPWVNLTIVPFMFLGIWLHGRLVRGRTAREGLGLTLIASGLVFLGFYLSPASLHREASLVFYYASGVLGIFLVTQVWIVAQECMDPRSARRLYTVLSGAGILGGLAGGLLAGLIGSGMAGHGPLLAAAVLCLGTTPLAYQRARKEDRGVAGPREGAAMTAREMGALLRHPYVRGLGAVVLFAGMSQVVVDYQWKLALQERMPEPTRLAGFLGTFYGLQSLAAFVLQIGLGSLLLTRIGVRATGTLLPAGIVAAALTGLFVPGFLLAVGARFFEGSFRISLTSTANEFYYFPLPETMRQRVKRFLESVVNRSSEAAGSLLLLLVGLLGGGPRVLWVLLAVLAGIWLGLQWRMGLRYVQELPSALRRMVSMPVDLRTSTSESRFLSELVAMLEERSPQQVVRALDLLEHLNPDQLPEHLTRLLHHPSGAVRRRAIELGMKTPDVFDLLELEALLQDPEEDVRTFTVLFFSKLAVGSPVDNLAALLASEDAHVRGAALLVVAEHSGPEDDARVQDVVERFLARGDVADRLAVARTLSLRPSLPGGDALLARLLVDEETDVRHEAIASCGRLGRRRDIPLLVERLAVPADRGAARAALAAFGNRVIGTLGDYLVDPGTATELRRQMPSVLGAIGTQEAADNLLRAPIGQDARLDVQVLKALNRMRTRGGVFFPSDRIAVQIHAEARVVTGHLVHRRALETLPDRGVPRLLRRVLDERIDAGLERIFRRLALVYPPREIHLAYVGVKSQNLRARAQAAEYLASVLLPAERQAVLPLVDLLPEEERVNNAASFFRYAPRTLPEALTEMALGGDVWLRACAVFLIGTARLGELAHVVEAATESLEPLLRDTGTWAARRMTEEGA